MLTEPGDLEATNCIVCGRELRKRYRCEQCPDVTCSGKCLTEHMQKLHPRRKAGEGCGQMVLATLGVGALVLLMMVGVLFLCCGGCTYLMDKVPAQ